MKTCEIESRNPAIIARITSDNFWNADNEDIDVRVFPPFLLAAFVIKTAHYYNLRMREVFGLKIKPVRFKLLLANGDDPLSSALLKGYQHPSNKIVYESEENETILI